MSAKNKLSTIEVLISENLIDSHISRDGFVSVINVLKEPDDMKDAIKNLKAISKYGW